MIKVGFLVLTIALSGRAGNTSTLETEQIRSLSGIKKLEIFGDSIAIVTKNRTESNVTGSDAFEQYLRDHLIRIQSPLDEGKYLHFELNDLILDDEAEGREKRRKGPIREILVPLLLALKYKSTVVLPIFMMLVTFIAFKGFWAGMTGLVISKVVGLKVLLQSLKKRDEDHDESEDQQDYEDHSPVHPSNDYDDLRRNEEEREGNAKPIVIYLHSHSQRRKLSQSYKTPPSVKGYYSPKTWGPWRKHYD